MLKIQLSLREHLIMSWDFLAACLKQCMEIIAVRWWTLVDHLFLGLIIQVTLWTHCTRDDMVK